MNPTTQRMTVPNEGAGAVPVPGGFGLYIHWPFCKSKCPYCDFNSHVRAAIDETRWRDGLLRELDHYAAEIAGAGGSPRRLDSIFFGGGTPSLMAPDTVARLIERARRHWTFAPDIEITLEANPTSVEVARFRALSQAGVNRVSIGIQALDDHSLKFLGRQHSASEALQAFEAARENFPRFTFDLIYARPGQTPAQWREELKAALSRAGGHLSLYQLTIEPGTAFEGAVARGEFAIPDEATQAALYEITQELTEAAGLPAYEISNHARPGEASRHNLVYWRYGDYVGVGPGAHGRLTLGGHKWATRQHRAPEPWLDMVERGGHATRQRDEVPAEARLEEMSLMGLRLSEGIARKRFIDETGSEPEALFDRAKLDRLIAGGFLTLDASGLKATAEGRQRLNALLPALLG
ncbi:coproporphyrinogen III oxidase [Hypericibacter terrae]|uniref:Heme chaperone HemW n=2 Tax=Hypericibacter terrae TaxID=2602015 RepID=A0A5J6MYS6_9PROT|nr:coproporphyrinogen III oxidase [Hypericibacter terrae]